MIFLFKIGFLEVSWVDIIDISLVSILLYQVYKLIRGSIAVNIFLGFLRCTWSISLSGPPRWNCWKPYSGNSWEWACWP